MYVQIFNEYSHIYTSDEQCIRTCIYTYMIPMLMCFFIHVFMHAYESQPDRSLVLSWEMRGRQNLAEEDFVS